MDQEGGRRRARRRGAPGAVVNLASVAGQGASGVIGWYGVSKAALIHLTTELGYELGPDVRVNAVAPAVVKTQFAEALYEGREEKVVPGLPDEAAGRAGGHRRRRELPAAAATRRGSRARR